MKAWLADILWGALAIVCQRLHDWIFSGSRAAKIRFQGRERWYAYDRDAATTGNKNKQRRAEFFRILFDFETPPGDAIARGDLADAPQYAAKVMPKYTTSDAGMTPPEP